jgi:epsilon-lactone hydrolase
VDQERARLGEGGSIYVNELTIAPSDLWSSQYKEFHAATAGVNAADFGARIPARTAPKADWDKFDAWVDEFYNARPLARVLDRYPADVQDTHLAGVRVGIITPRREISRPGCVLINLHGGSFVFNRGLSYGLLEAVPVAVCSGMKVVTLDYRQAPFHSYPAATEDVEAVYTQLLKQYRPQSIGIFGCSAGAALTSQALARFQSTGLPRPGAISMSAFAPPPPWIPPPSGHGWGDSGIWFSGLPKSELSDADQVRLRPMEWYMESARLDDPQAYPGSSDSVLAKFPPTLLLTGTRDFTMSTVVVAHARLVRLGVVAALYIMEGARHAAHVMAVGTPEAHDAHAYIAHWLCDHLEQ